MLSRPSLTSTLENVEKTGSAPLPPPLSLVRARVFSPSLFPSWDTTPCQVTPVILHGVVPPASTVARGRASPRLSQARPGAASAQREIDRATDLEGGEAFLEDAVKAVIVFDPR